MALILIVDDEIGIAKLLEEVMQDEGHRTVLASNGKQALERVAAERPDVIITDFMMPVMDGGVLVATLADEPSTANIPVMVMSSLPDSVIRDRCPGATLIVRKPFNIFSVAEKVVGLMRRGDDVPE